ncbi:MAG: hypothetical protein NWE89_14015 [Candidatus Bathyarchaeota archaeon]|nr:hypothetical protein [Candidatus Bathyarchaeota archaeon]
MTQKIEGSGKYLAVLIPILTLLLAGGTFWYTQFYNQPKLSYEILDSYPISDWEIVTPIVFQNTGRSLATNIVINIHCTGTIQNQYFTSPDEIELLNNTGRKLRIKMERLVHGAKTSVYISTSPTSDTPFSEISMTSDQGLGKAYVSSSSIFPKYFEIFSLILAGLTLGITITNKLRIIKEPKLITVLEPETEPEPETTHTHPSDDNSTESRKLVVVGSKSSHLYRLPSCKFASSISRRNRIEFKSKLLAQIEGYNPCRICNPE